MDTTALQASTPYLIGMFLAFVVCMGARWTRLDRDGAFYPVVLIVVASYYVLFAVMANAPWWHELAYAGIFTAIALCGFHYNPWLPVLGLPLHGLFDMLHPALLEPAGVPVWWPAFCLSFDVTAGLYAAAVLRSRNA